MIAADKHPSLFWESGQQKFISAAFLTIIAFLSDNSLQAIQGLLGLTDLQRGTLTKWKTIHSISGVFRLQGVAKCPDMGLFLAELLSEMLVMIHSIEIGLERALFVVFVYCFPQLNMQKPADYGPQQH